MGKTDDFDLAILYWFYKEPDITRNHLELIRKNNPNSMIYGLFGGNPNEVDKYSDLLSDLLDDLWIYPGTYGTDSYTKWVRGDLLLLDWYDKRGRGLKWDSIAITQWDMLLFSDIKTIVPGIKSNQVFFSGYRELDYNIEKQWRWTAPNEDHRQEYIDFCQKIAKNYDYTNCPKCCLYIFEILTRGFFEAYLKLPVKQIGVLEYTNPTLACIFGLDIYEYDLGVYWRGYEESLPLDNYPLNDFSIDISKKYINKEMKKSNGWRLFHPYETKW